MDSLGLSHGHYKERNGYKVQIYLFRHGETDWNKARRLQGQSDIPLNAYGRELAHKTAEALQSVPFDKAFSSPLSRAKETAQIILGKRNIPLTTDERLLEINFGDCEGQCFDTAKQNPNHPLHHFFCAPQSYLPPEGGETFHGAINRGNAFLQEQILPLEGCCETILIVAHGAFNRCILNAISNTPLENFWKTALPNCAASILSLHHGKFTIETESKVYYGTPVNGRP